MLQCKTSVSARALPTCVKGLGLLALSLVLGGLTACGQKGPLVLPKPQSAASAPGAQ